MEISRSQMNIYYGIYSAPMHRMNTVRNMLYVLDWSGLVCEAPVFPFTAIENTNSIKRGTPFHQQLQHQQRNVERKKKEPYELYEYCRYMYC